MTTTEMLLMLWALYLPHCIVSILVTHRRAGEPLTRLSCLCRGMRVTLCRYAEIQDLCQAGDEPMYRDSQEQEMGVSRSNSLVCDGCFG